MLVHFYGLLAFVFAAQIESEGRRRILVRSLVIRVVAMLLHDRPDLLLLESLRTVALLISERVDAVVVIVDLLLEIPECVFLRSLLFLARFLILVPFLILDLAGHQLLVGFQQECILLGAAVVEACRWDTC